MSRLVASQRAWLAPSWVREDLSRKAQALPSLDLRFAESKSLTDAATGSNLVTFTRASSGTYVGSDGVLKTATTNEPRFDHNPTTGESLGLLVEEQRTNSIRNNTMVGAVAGTPGTLPTNWGVSGAGTLIREIVGVGVDNGINYIDIRFSGTTSTTQVGIRFETSNGAAGTNGQTLTYALWFARVAGSLSNITAISCNANLYDAATVYLTTPGFTGFDSATNATSFIGRAGTLTIASATSAFIQPQIALSFNSGVAIDITLRIGMPQLEQGAFATSVIPTTGTAATRSADVASITGTNFSSWYRQSEGAMLAMYSASTPGPYSALNKIAAFQPVSVGSYGAIAINGGAQTGWFVSGNGRPVSATAYFINKQSIAYIGTQWASAANGLISVSNSSDYAGTSTSLAIGGGAAAISRLTYWPQRLPDSTLQGITQ